MPSAQCSVIDPTRAEKLSEYVDLLLEKRKKKKMEPEQARQLLMEDPNYFGTLMTLAGDADGMVSGAMHTTAATIRPGLQVSHIFKLIKPWQPPDVCQSHTRT